MLTFIYLFFIRTALAFPEMIRHHYVNCSACHVATNGGGLLNAYGRTISSEVLSSFGSEKEARAFYTVDPENVNQWLNIGGDLRGLQLHQENERSIQGRFIWMEANIQAAVSIEKLTAFMSMGKVNQGNQSLVLVPTKYYVSYQMLDELSVKIGRFTPSYGLNIPQHNFLVRKNLHLGPGTERNAIDMQWNGEKFNFTLGLSQSLLNSAVRDEEVALNLQALMNINDQHKIGLNYWYGEANQYKKIMIGAQAVLGFSENFYALTELDHIWNKSNSNAETKSLFELFKLGYELHKGFHLQAVQEFGKSDTTSSAETQILGAGIIWYPRPHFEFEMLWSNRRTAETLEDYAYLLLHYYF